jgi:hypothetical protein
MSIWPSSDRPSDRPLAHPPPRRPAVSEPRDRYESPRCGSCQPGHRATTVRPTWGSALARRSRRCGQGCQGRQGSQQGLNDRHGTLAPVASLSVSTRAAGKVGRQSHPARISSRSPCGPRRADLCQSRDSSFVTRYADMRDSHAAGYLLRPLDPDRDACGVSAPVWGSASEGAVGHSPRS